MKFGVVVFPGSNCDKDMIYVLETLYEQEVVSLWHKDTDLQNCDFIVLPADFHMEIICVQELLHVSRPLWKKL